MNAKPTIAVQTPDKLEIQVPCIHCNGSTYHRALTLVRWEWISDPEYTFWSNYKTIQCQGCKTLSFAHEQGSVKQSEGESVPGATSKVEIYPNRIVGGTRIKDDHLLPPEVHQIYQETQAALHNKLPLLASIGIRSILETVCREKQSKGKVLKERIDSLVQLGFVTQEAATFLHELRFMGNRAAHEIRVDQDSLLTAFRIVEHLLTGVYILTHRAREITEARLVSQSTV